jgi:hypothetical protein
MQMVAKLLSNALAGISLDLGVLSRNVSTSDIARAAETDTPAGTSDGAGDAEMAAQLPNLMRLFNLTASNNRTGALQSRERFAALLRQQQSAGADILGLEVRRRAGAMWIKSGMYAA